MKSGMTPAHICSWFKDSKELLLKSDLMYVSITICLQQKSSNYQFGKWAKVSNLVLVHIIYFCGRNINNTSHPVFTDRLKFFWNILVHMKPALATGKIPIEQNFPILGDGWLDRGVVVVTLLPIQRFSTETGGNVQELQAKFGVRQLSFNLPDGLNPRFNTYTQFSVVSSIGEDISPHHTGIRGVSLKITQNYQVITQNHQKHQFHQVSFVWTWTLGHEISPSTPSFPFVFVGEIFQGSYSTMS